MSAERDIVERLGEALARVANDADTPPMSEKRQRLIDSVGVMQDAAATIASLRAEVARLREALGQLDETAVAHSRKDPAPLISWRYVLSITDPALADVEAPDAPK